MTCPFLPLQACIIPSFHLSLQLLWELSSQNPKVRAQGLGAPGSAGRILIRRRVPACASTGPWTLGWLFHPFLSLSFPTVRMGRH